MPAATAENRIFQALADPSRRAIFHSLTRGEAAVKDLTARFDISQPAVSQHLATLKAAGLVRGRREGRRVYYRVEPRGMKPLIDWIAHYRAFTLTPTASGTRLSLVHSGFKPDQKKNFGGARYGWKMMGGKLVDLTAKIP